MLRLRLVLLTSLLAACDPSFDPEWARPDELLRNDGAVSELDSGPSEDMDAAIADSGSSDADDLDASSAMVTIPCQIMNECTEAGCTLECKVDCAVACEAGFECVDATKCKLRDCSSCSNYVPTIK